MDDTDNIWIRLPSARVLSPAEMDLLRAAVDVICASPTDVWVGENVANPAVEYRG